jgi:hypothetical protein
MTRSLSLLLLRCVILVSAIHRSNDHGRHAIANGDEQGPTMSVYQYFTLLSDTTSGKVSLTKQMTISVGVANPFTDSHRSA